MISINLPNKPDRSRPQQSAEGRRGRHKGQTPRNADLELPDCWTGGTKLDSFEVDSHDTITCFVPTLAKAQTDPLGALIDCRYAVEGLEKGYHRKLYETLAAAYGAYRALERDFRSWTKLVRDDFWKKRRRKPRRDNDYRNILKFVLIYVFDGIGRARNDRAWKYERALQLYASKDVPPEQVAARIEQDGGLEKLYEKAVKEQPRRPRKSGGLSSEVWDDLMDLDTPFDDPEGDPPMKPPELSGRPRTPLIFEVEVTPRQLQRLLGIPKGCEAELSVKRISAGVGWKRYKAIKVKPAQRDD